MDWRFTLDVPYDFATEPGATIPAFCRDFRTAGSPANGTYRDSTTGLVMLQPTFFDRGSWDNDRAITEWRSAPGFWQQALRGPSVSAGGGGGSLITKGMTNVKPTSSGFALIEILVEVAIYAIKLALSQQDTLVWALESTFLLGPDEGWVLHYHSLSDQMMRKYNWLQVQWSDIGITFGQDGHAWVTDYSADPDNPLLVEHFQFANPVDISNRDGYLVFLPVPGYGLLFYHGHRPPASMVALGAAEVLTCPSHLISWPSKTTGEGYLSLFDASPVRIAINPYQRYLLNVQAIRYPASGSYLCPPFDPGYAPSHDPDRVQAGVLNTVKQTCTATLRKADDSGDWSAAAGDRKGRVRLDLTTDDPVYTPFVQGYQADWSPVRATRNTTPVVPRWTSLEICDDESARVEGTCELLADTAAVRGIVLRGDATWQLEYSDDGGATWTTWSAGLAVDWEAEDAYDATGPHLRATCKLVDMHERLREVHSFNAAAFDGLDMETAINNVLRPAGFTPITVPAGLKGIVLPVAGQGDGWRYAININDDGEEILRKLLVHARQQYSEWRLRWDWDLATWVAEKRPRSTDAADAWTLVARDEDEDVTNRLIRYSTLRFRPEAPDCNVLLMVGADQPGPAGTRLTACIINQASLTDESSHDYLGRIKSASYTCAEISDKAELLRMARRVEALAMHRNLTGAVELPVLAEGPGPNAYLYVLDSRGDELFTAWAKRRTIQLDGFGASIHGETVKLEFDELWEGDLP